jgi:hypothetical protein
MKEVKAPSALLADLMKDASLERWVEYTKLLNENFFNLDNKWMSEIEKRYGDEVALEFDRLCYVPILGLIASKLKEFFVFPGDDDLSILAKVYQLSPFGSFVNYEFELAGNRLTRRVRKCPMQLSRRERGDAEEPCKPSLIEAAATIAKAISPRIKVTHIICPPDPHPEDFWCELTFEV